MKKTRHIAILGGSFDPPHRGHLAVLQALARNPRFYAVWVMPVFDHAFGKKLSPYENRVRMAELLVEDVGQSHVHVMTTERDLGKRPSYTIDLIEALMIQHPQDHYTLVLGSDARADLPRWQRSDDLQKLVDFEFIPRAGYEDSPYPNVSSTEIREKCARGENISGLTTEKIVRYLQKLKP